MGMVVMFPAHPLFDSFTYPQLGFRVEGSQVSLAKIGNVKIHLHRPLAGEIKTLTSLCL